MSQTSKPKRRLKRGISNFLLAILFLAGFLVLLYPTISNWWNERVNAQLINQYESVMQEIDDTAFDEIYAAAREYNDQHTQNVFTDAFTNEHYILTHPYDTLLNPMGNEIMGYIEIPKIAQRLAIGHGVGITTLEQGVGHVEGTSLPIGGPGTHSVLAGHRGLPNAKIFTDLDQIVEGDKFFLYILNDIMAYEVDQIVVCKPNDDSNLQLEEGKDLVTLLTCTPYGVNTERLLIRGHRIDFQEEDITAQASQYRISDREKPIYILAGGMAVLLLVLIVMRIYLAKKNTNEQKGG